MSRGLGQIQQQLLALLTKHRKHQHKDLLSTFDLTAAVYAIAPDPVTGIQYLSEAQLSAVRRALISMAKRGLVCGARGYRDRQQHWALPHVFVQSHEHDRDFLRGLGLSAPSEVEESNTIKHGRENYQQAKQKQKGDNKENNHELPTPP